MRKLKLSWALFKILKMSLPVLKAIQSIKLTLKDIFNGNWNKLYTQSYKWFLRKKARILYDVSIGFKKLKRIN